MGDKFKNKYHNNIVVVEQIVTHLGVSMVIFTPNALLPSRERRMVLDHYTFVDSYEIVVDD